MSKSTQQDLEDIEASLEPISEAAQAIRDRIGDGFLEPSDLAYVTHVDSVIASIGAGKVIEPDYTEARKRMREQRLTVENYRFSLEYWRLGWPCGRARSDLLANPVIVDEVYETLGEPDDEKKAIVEMVVARLDPVHRDLTRPEEIQKRLGTWEPENPAVLEEKLFHEVTRLDLGTWKTVPNIQTMIRNIGAKDRQQELHCWIGNPDDIPLLQLRARAIRDWLAGRIDEPDARERAASLGQKDAYKEKVWLASALLHLLETHASDERVTKLVK